MPLKPAKATLDIPGKRHGGKSEQMVTNLARMSRYCLIVKPFREWKTSTFKGFTHSIGRFIIRKELKSARYRQDAISCC